MSKVFTYSRLPEHQVAIYHDDSSKPGKPHFSLFPTLTTHLFTFQFSHFRATNRMERCGVPFLILRLLTSSYHISNFNFLLHKGKLKIVLIVWSEGLVKLSKASKLYLLSPFILIKKRSCE